jgi:hypothetical protein
VARSQDASRGETMERLRTGPLGLRSLAHALVAASMLVAAGGCGAMLATGMYVIQGGNTVPPEFDGLKSERVVVVCRPPSSNEYRHAGASRAVSQKVSELLVNNLKNVDVVNPREVDNWLDESDWGDYKELAKAVKAEKVVYIELNDFDLFKGTTLYQGHADVSVTVYDMKNNGRLAWDRHLGELLYPTNSGIPAQDKPEQQFEREFVNVVATRVAENFYKHDANSDFALDALANR